MESRFWGVIGVGAAAVAGLISAGMYYIGYRRGMLADRRTSFSQLKSYENKDDPLIKYLLEHNVEDPVLSRLREFTISLPSGGMATPVEEGAFLTILCKAIRARKVIDVGVFTGCSAYAMALGLPAGGKVVACDVNLETIEQGRPYWEEGGVSGKIDLHIQPATKTLQELIDNGEEGSYDLIFIDADKPNYPNYYELGLPLLRPGGMVVVDNAIFSGVGSVYDMENTIEDVEAIRSLNRTMRDDERIDFVLLNFAKGVGIGVKK